MTKLIARFTRGCWLPRFFNAKEPAAGRAEASCAGMTGRTLAAMFLTALGVAAGHQAQAQTQVQAPASAQAPASIRTQVQTESGCNPAGDVRFICGVTNVEDFAPIPGTRWLIGSDLARPQTEGYLYLFDTTKHSAVPVKPEDIAVQPDRTLYPDCPGPVDLKLFGPHGIDLARGNGPLRTLYAVNHGGRESVEVFQLDLPKGRSADHPRFTWVGCVVAPKGFWPDAVASLPGGGIVVTSLWDPTDPDRVARLSHGQPVGGLDEWWPGKGWSPLPGAEGLSGPNGVIASPDGSAVYIAVWSGRQLVRISRGQTPPRKLVVPTGILTDNVRWAPSGRSILVGGQDTTVPQVLTCFESAAVNCAVPFKIFRADPATLRLTDLVKSGVYGVFGAGTGAVQIGREIWVSSFRADRIAIFPAGSPNTLRE